MAREVWKAIDPRLARWPAADDNPKGKDLSVRRSDAQGDAEPAKHAAGTTFGIAR
jgi:hypothetical protein